MNRVVPRLFYFVRPYLSLLFLAVFFAVATIGSGIALMGASAWLISAAALGPSIADLQVAIVAVRFFGIARGVFRYLERLISHTMTLRTLARLRVWFYQTLEPLSPARLYAYRSGDLLSRILADVETLESFYARAIVPVLGAGFIVLGMVCSFGDMTLCWGWLRPCF